MPNEIIKDTLHPESDESKDIYPKTSFDQIVGFTPVIVDGYLTKIIIEGIGEVNVQVPIKLYKHTITLTGKTNQSDVIGYYITIVVFNDVSREYLISDYYEQSIYANMIFGYVRVRIENHFGVPSIIKSISGYSDHISVVYFDGETGRELTVSISRSNVSEFEDIVHRIM